MSDHADLFASVAEGDLQNYTLAAWVCLGVTAAVVPEGAAAAHPLAQQAAARGLPCVTPGLVFALLTEQDPAPLALAAPPTPEW